MNPVAYLAAAAAALTLMASPAPAHAPHVGPAGGQTIHWGTYHFELVPGSNGSRIFVYRASDRKPVRATAMSATAQIVTGGKPVSARFQSVGGNVLASPQARLSGDWTASVSLKLPGASPTLRYSARELAAMRRAGAKG